MEIDKKAWEEDIRSGYWCHRFDDGSDRFILCFDGKMSLRKRVKGADDSFDQKFVTLKENLTVEEAEQLMGCPVFHDNLPRMNHRN